jgi:hypothetical protein
MTSNPLDDTDETRRRHVQERAYHLWEAEGRPHGRESEFWERASDLVGMEESGVSGQIPVEAERPEEAFLQENLGEFPGRQTDQGDKEPTPSGRRRKSA